MAPSAQLGHSYNLYFKFNDFDCDPLGEDPATPARREATLAALGSSEIGELYPVLSRRLDSVARAHARHEWWETSVRAKLWGGDEAPLTSAQFRLLQTVDGVRDVDTLAEAGAPDDDVAAAVRAMAEIGVLNLLRARRRRAAERRGRRTTGLRASSRRRPRGTGLARRRAGPGPGLTRSATGLARPTRGGPGPGSTGGRPAELDA